MQTFVFKILSLKQNIITNLISTAHRFHDNIENLM